MNGPGEKKPRICPGCFSCKTSVWGTARDFEYCTTDDEVFHYYQCDDCKTIFLDPKPTDRLSTIYPKNYYSFVAGTQSLTKKLKSFLDRMFFASILKKLHTPAIKALDVGGGTGWQLDTLRDVDPRIQHTQVVDLDPEAQRKAEANGHQFFCGKIEDFATDERYDLILLLNIIEHVADPEDILKKVAGLLSHQGIAIIQTPNTNSLDARIFKSSYWGGLHCPRHWVLFTDENIEPMIERAGLKIRELSLTQGAPFWTNSILVWLGNKEVIRIDKQRSVIDHPLHKILLIFFAGFDFIRSTFSKTSQMLIVVERNY